MLSVLPALPATPYRPSRRKPVSLSPRKPKPRPRVSDPYHLHQVPHAEPEESNDEPEAFRTDITFFDQQTNQFKSIQPEEIDQLFSLLLNHFPGVIAVMPVLPFLIIECNPLPDPAKQPFMVAGLVAVFIKEGWTISIWC